MCILVSSTETEVTAARLGRPGEGGSPPAAPELSAADLEVFRGAMARMSLGLFLDPATRGALTTEQHLEMCGRAGREALRADVPEGCHR